MSNHKVSVQSWSFVASEFVCCKPHFNKLDARFIDGVVCSGVLKKWTGHYTCLSDLNATGIMVSSMIGKEIVMPFLKRGKYVMNVAKLVELLLLIEQ